MNRPDSSYESARRLSTPVMLNQLSYTAMGIIDTIMVGRVGVVALASVGIRAHSPEARRAACESRPRPV